ncbi:MAG: putative Ig domain-containing protein [Thermodesulfovibrionales bacterium]|jgi:hypothetical protein
MKNCCILLGLFFSLLMLQSIDAYGMSSANYVIQCDVFSMGGGEGSSSDYNNSSTTGQPLSIGASASTGYSNNAGFWYEPSTDTTPDPFTFTPQTGVALNTVIISNIITVTGINAPAPISIIGGSYSINGGPFTSVSGTVDNGANVRVLQTSSSSYSSISTATLTIGDVSGPFNVTTMAIPTYTVTPAAGSGGSINPSAPQTINYNSTTAFTLTPNTGYHVASVTGCGGTLAGNTYTTGPITADCTVTAAFAINTFTITASAGANGSISPSGATTVNYGASKTFTVTPNANYHVADVLVDGSSVVAVTSHTFNNVTVNHTISATFAINDLNITTSSLPSATFGTPYNQTLTATGGVPPYGWSITSGSLPNGLTLCTSDSTPSPACTGKSGGMITGTPITSGTSNFIIQVMDANLFTAVKNFSIAIQQILPVKIDTGYYSNLQDAYDACSDGGIVKIQAIDFLDDLVCDHNVSIILKGGYDSGFTVNPAYTTINGKLTISNGKVILEKIIIK